MNTLQTVLFCFDRLVVKTSSWQKNSFGLFDFECKDLQKSTVRLEGTGKLFREERSIVNEQDKKRLKIQVKGREEELSAESSNPKTGKKETSLAKVMQQGDGYWIYHKNKVDLQSMFSQPEEKLWIVVKDYNGVLDQNKDSQGNNEEFKRGIRLEKNSVIKMGRVRLRVRDIDYADQNFNPE